MDEQLLEQVKQLFRESYNVIYNDGKFDTMADQVEADGDVVPGVSQLVAAILDSTIKDAGIDDVNVLFGLGIMLIGDLLESLQELGIEAPEGSVEVIISKVMAQVLGNNPAIAQKVASDPSIQQAMQQAGGPEGIQQTVQQEAAAGNPMAQGVQEGAQNAGGVL